MKASELFEEKFDLIKVIVTAVLLTAATVLFHFVGVVWYVRLIVYITLYLFIGYETVIEMVKGFKKSPFNENFLMVVATVGAFIMGEYFEAVVVMLLFAVGELFEDYAHEKSENAILSLAELMPDTAAIRVGGEDKKVKVDDVNVGDKLVVKTGDRIVCDGVVLEGSASVDNSMLTGESVPITALNGTYVYSGGVVKSGFLVIEVTKEAAESSASKILNLVKEETEKKAGSEKFIRRFAKIYTPVVLILALLVATVPPLLTGLPYGEQLPEWIKRALNLLVISCPCALVISVPLAYFAGVGNAFKKGIIVKGGVALEKAATIDKVVFDKTGTLTSGDFAVKSVNAETDEKYLLKVAASLERFSNHPIAAAILKKYDNEVIEGLSIEEIAGHGIIGRADNTYAAGNFKLMRLLNVACDPVDTADTVVYVAKDNKLIGRIFIGDSVKEGVNDAIAGLNAMKIDVAMLTGDTEKTAQKVANDLAITDYKAGLLPDQKQKIVAEYAKTSSVAFVGDGINDAPSLATSKLAVAMGSGTDVATLCSDVIITDNNVKKIPTLIKLAKKTARIVKENIFGSIFVKVAALILSVVGLAPMWLAILADVGIMALACLNSMRLLKD